MPLRSLFRMLPQLMLFRARIDFGTEPHQRKLTLTFNFLTSILGLIATLTFLWGLAAGLLHATLLTTQLGTAFGDAPERWQSVAGWLAPPLGAVVYTMEAIATALLVFLAASCIGAIVGFLFGVPRPISESGSDGAITEAQTPAQPAAAADGPPPPRAAVRAATNWRASTNLTQVSDWLTKIIVGVGLVEARPIYEAFTRMSGSVSGTLFGGQHGAAVVIPCLVLAGWIMGFLYSYLFTQLFLAAMMVFSADEVGHASPLEGKEAAVAQMQNLPAASATLAGGMGGAKGSGTPVREPTAAERDAASSIGGVPLEELRDPAGIQAWARGKAISRDYQNAAAGYRRLLRLVSTPEVLAEAARVIAQSGAQAEAAELLRRAVLERDKVAPDVRLRITSDAANLALYEPPPRGYAYALSLLTDQVMEEDRQARNGQLFVLRACANGQRLRALADEMTPEAKAALTDSVLRDVRTALEINPDTKRWMRFLWDPGAEGKSGQADNIRDNDLEPFFDDQRFKDLLG